MPLPGPNTTKPLPATEIVLQGLSKRFGDQTALDSVTFEAHPGEVLGLLGPNGAGKTTVINILSTLMAPDSGRAQIGGHDVVTSPASVRKLIALTGQFAAVDDILTATENLTLFGRLRGLRRTEARTRANELLERFGLADVESDQVKTFSGGMRRRLDIAVSLVVPTPVLFLDEPTTGLDPLSRSELWQTVRELRSDGLTIVLTTQYLEEADQLADRIVVIDDGRLIAQGTPNDLKAQSGGQTCVVAPVDRRQVDALATLLADVEGVKTNPDTGTLTMPASEPNFLSHLVRLLDESTIEIAEVALRRRTLDEVFLELTGGKS